MMMAMIVVIFWLGFHPQPLLNTARPALDRLQRYTVESQSVVLSERQLPFAASWPGRAGAFAADKLQATFWEGKQP